MPMLYSFTGSFISIYINLHQLYLGLLYQIISIIFGFIISFYINYIWVYCITLYQFYLGLLYQSISIIFGFIILFLFILIMFGLIIWFYIENIMVNYIDLY